MCPSCVKMVLWCIPNQCCFWEHAYDSFFVSNIYVFVCTCVHEYKQSHQKELETATIYLLTCFLAKFQTKKDKTIVNANRMNEIVWTWKLTLQVHILRSRIMFTSRSRGMEYRPNWSIYSQVNGLVDADLAAFAFLKCCFKQRCCC